jgi:hypothetical protein
MSRYVSSPVSYTGCANARGQTLDPGSARPGLATPRGRLPGAGAGGGKGAHLLHSLRFHRKPVPSETHPSFPLNGLCLPQGGSLSAFDPFVANFPHRGAGSLLRGAGVAKKGHTERELGSIGRLGSMRDLFGNEIGLEEARRLLRSKTPQRRGYAAPPGSGPAGETCKTCLHYTHGGSGSRSFPKCALRQATWNHSYGTDILARAPACRKWEAGVR